MKRVAAAVLAVLTLLMACSGRSQPATPSGPDPAGSVVQVFGEVCRRDAQGSGVLVSEDLVLTSAHTLAGSEGELQARRPGAPAVPATAVGFDSERDLAVVSAPGIGGEPAIFGEGAVGEDGVIGTVDVDGNLELLDYSVERLVIANSGDIYDEGEVTRAALQLSAQTLPGDSGGAVFDSANRVIGMVFAQSRGAAPIAYAVAAQEIQDFLAELDPTTQVSTGRCR